MKRFFLFLGFSLLFYQSIAQKYSTSEDIRFSRHLIDNNQYKDAIYVLKKILKEKNSHAAADSVNYYIGWCYYNLKILDSSSIFLDRVKQGPFYPKAPFYAAFNKAYLSKLLQAKTSLDSIKTGSDSSLTKFLNFEFACVALLERNYTEYEKSARNFSYNYFPISEEEKNLSAHYSALKKVKKKSSFLAGTMSAIIPGSGKIYAGYTGQGIAALLTVGVLGLSALECYHKTGYKSPQFIIFGSVFTIFYVGNIWGSTLSVKLASENQFHKTDDQILFDMHIPLRRFFN